MVGRSGNPEYGQDPARPTLRVAAAALIDANGRVLLARRPEGKTMAGLWEFPGGKIEAGEAPKAALVRELKEELGIDVRPGALYELSVASHEYPEFHLLMTLFSCRDWQGQPEPQEGQAFRWVRPRDMRALAMPPADAPLIDLLADLV